MGASVAPAQILDEVGASIRADAGLSGTFNQTRDPDDAHTAPPSSSYDVDCRDNIVRSRGFSNRLVGNASEGDEGALTDASLSFDDYSLYSATRTSRPSEAGKSRCIVHQGTATVRAMLLKNEYKLPSP